MTRRGSDEGPERRRPPAPRPEMGIGYLVRPPASRSDGGVVVVDWRRRRLRGPFDYQLSRSTARRLPPPLRGALAGTTFPVPAATVPGRDGGAAPAPNPRTKDTGPRRPRLRFPRGGRDGPVFGHSGWSLPPGEGRGMDIPPPGSPSLPPSLLPLGPSEAQKPLVNYYHPRCPGPPFAPTGEASLLAPAPGGTRVGRPPPPLPATPRAGLYRSCGPLTPGRGPPLPGCRGDGRRVPRWRRCCRRRCSRWWARRRRPARTTTSCRSPSPRFCLLSFSSWDLTVACSL
ncbi:F-box only protein 36 isoform X1 [Ornithorhynchus anatinus]|uniref:F-box only protein 36 isoform X1 n=1 Tax=Ornithorhynchus anatinus TaxID=9258 RepID=UPI0019D42066|nr:F-box only protein 36 isoform X1 [Ornithorhynchus anatinus]